MSNLDASASMTQFIDLFQNIKLPIMGAGGGFAPIGTINFFDASVAPQGWLACDGSVVNIADYPDLATYYASVHGSANFYGGNGTTTFAVPDLRGEFLRGTGTNSHTNQGDGANVGVHQDGSIIAEISRWSGGIGVMTPSVYNADSHIYLGSGVSDVNYQQANRTLEGIASDYDGYASRPTNTSFLICVKATVAGDPNAHHYSTEEQVVGKWIDGKDEYEKTIVLSSPISINANDWATTSISSANMYMITNVTGINPDGTFWGQLMGGLGGGTYLEIGNARSSQITLKTIVVRYIKSS